VMLFALAWVGPKLGTSMLVAGFAAGLLVSAFGVSTRLTTQIVGIGEGFLIPAFFVVLGTALEPNGLTTVHGLILMAGLIIGTVVVHLFGGLAAGYSSRPRRWAFHSRW
jgi:Kef-type K+ transport system membrane component KefB